MKRKHIAHSDDAHFEGEVKNLLLFRRIVKAEAIDDQTGVLTLDNGTELVVEGNEGCGGCGNGWFYLEKLNDCDNAITNVKCMVEGDDDDLAYHIFVFAENKQIECVRYEGYDNGYYGTGYNLYVKVKKGGEG
jgi:hypothetical protein